MKTLLVMTLFLSGCAAGTITHKEDGTCKAQFFTLFKSAEAVDLCGASAKKSSSDPVLDALLDRLVP